MNHTLTDPVRGLAEQARTLDDYDLCARAADCEAVVEQVEALQRSPDPGDRAAWEAAVETVRARLGLAPARAFAAVGRGAQG